jgi:hypothetical protein
MKSKEKLSEIIAKLEREISKTKKSITPITSDSRMSLKRAYTILLVQNYEDVVLILKRIFESIKRSKEISESVFSETTIFTRLRIHIFGKGNNNCTCSSTNGYKKFVFMDSSN